MKNVNVEVTMNGEVMVAGLKGAAVNVVSVAGLEEYVASRIELAVTEVLRTHGQTGVAKESNEPAKSTSSVIAENASEVSKNEAQLKSNKKVENGMNKTIEIVKHNERMVEFKINNTTCHVGFGRDSSNFFEAYNGQVKPAIREDVLKRIAAIKADQSMRLQYIIKNLKPVSTNRVKQQPAAPTHVCFLSGKAISDKVAQYSLKEFGIKLEMSEQRKIRALLEEATNRSKAPSESEAQQPSLKDQIKEIDTQASKREVAPEIVDVEELDILSELQQATQENIKQANTKSITDAGALIPNMNQLMNMTIDELPEEMRDALTDIQI